MSIALTSLPNIVPSGGLQGIGRALPSPQAGGSFASVLEGAIQAVEQPGQQAGKSIQNFLNGDGEELHNVALSVQRASLAFDLGLQVRNKVVSAYQEVMRMQM